ncbi:MAG: phytoene desaturase family protein [Xanthobacteraceae bacterium]
MIARGQIVMIGAGIGGLVAALECAARGFPVTVVERAAAPGGKMREIAIGGARIDAGPTVFTMRWVFDELFASVGTALDAHLKLTPVGVLARHAWSAGERLDLFADKERSVEAISTFAGPAEGRRYSEFCGRARRIYETLERPFLRSARGNPLTLARNVGLTRIGDLHGISPFTTMWSALGRHFHDGRLRQLFGRYATYCGSSPFLAPATLMLVAHVEQEGVWLVEGGMHRLARVLAALAESKGAIFRYEADAREVTVSASRVSGVRLASGEWIAADAVVINADPAAVAAGLLGRTIAAAAAPIAPSERSLSALTWTMAAPTAGFPLLRHNVFFSSDYAAEFDDIFACKRLPRAPTVYVCAQDRGDDDGAAPAGAERLLCLVNAPPFADSTPIAPSEIAACERQTFSLLERCGLRIHRDPAATIVTRPSDFHRLFPGTGGALYGRASHGWQASFQRPGARTRIPNLYLAGGSTHPGAGVPMAALSGRLAAASLMADLGLTSRSSGTVISGGTSTV